MLASPPPPAIAVVYTADARGLRSTRSHLGEPSPLYDPTLRGNLEPGGFQLDQGVLLAEGRYVLWGATGPLEPPQARAALAGVRLHDAGREVAVMRSDYATLIEEPADGPAWLLGWLDAKLRVDGRFPDARLGRGRLFAAEGANGVKLAIVSLDGSTPGAKVLTDFREWRWPIAHRLPVKRGDEQRRLLAVGREYGGPRVHHEAGRKRAALGALRVDAGNLCPSAGDRDGVEALLAALPGMKLDAVVPDAAELRLGRADLARLAAGAPLVAANLTAPAGLAVRPFVIHERAGRKLAVIGLADEAQLTRLGLVGGDTGWKAEPAIKALKRASADARQSGADALLLVTNLSEERLPAVLDEAEDVTAVISPHRRRTELAFAERFTPVSPERARYRRPWLVAGAERGDVGVLTIGFPAGPGRRPAWAENALKRHADDLPGAEDPVAYWGRVAASSLRSPSATDMLLPDKRLLAAREPRLARGEAGVAAAYYDGRDWSMIGASGLRREAGAEVGLIHTRQGGSTIIGEISRLYVEEWMPAERAVTLALTGEQLQRLAAIDPDGKRFTFANYDAAKHLIGGRPVVAGEVYQVATTEAIARSDDYREILAGAEAAPVAGDRTLRQLIVARLTARRAQDPGFGAANQRLAIADLTDDGAAFEPRWRLDVRPLSASFQQFRVANRQPFGAVRNSLINAPDSTILGGKGDMSLTYEAAQVDWENRGILGYQRADFRGPTGAGEEPQEQADNVQLTSELRLKAFKLQAPDAAMALVPFVNGNYLTEFTPTVDPQTQAANPRRRELNGIAGVVLYPGGWLKEVRLGAIAKNDLAVAVGGYEPGVQLAGLLEQPLGPLTLAVDADVKNYFLTPEDTADDLGVMGRVSTAVRIPIWGALGLSVGVDAFVFGGKVPETRTIGTSWTPTVGLTWRAAWKPGAGILYGLPGNP